MAETRLTPELELEGMSLEEVFAILGDETRLEIIRVLWKAGARHEYDDLDDSTTTMSFSELRRRAGIDDNGRFNYHLSKLTPHFVRQADEGYRLSDAGRKITRTVVAISRDPTPDGSGEVETDCPMCGGPVTATYEDQWLRFSCTECDGLFGDTTPEGTIVNTSFPPAGITDRTPDEALTTSLYRCMLDLTYMMRGICRECAGPVRGSMSVCDKHDADAGRPCETCGTPFAAWGEVQCDVCRFAKHLPVELCVMGLPPVIAFLYRQDIDVLAPSFDEVVEVLSRRVETSVTEDPPRVTATIEAGCEELTLMLDERMSVIDVSH